MLKSQKIASFKGYLESLDSTSQSGYSLWRAARNIKRPIIPQPPLRQPCGDWAKTDSEKGSVFVQHLKKVFTPNVSNNENSLPPIVARPPVPIKFELNDILKGISNLDTKKAPGIDKISNKMILELPSTVLKTILFIFNAILRLEHYPAKWKLALVIMIPKSGKDHTKAESYRPISLLPVLSKLFERLLMAKLIPIITEVGCIPNHQFGFRRRHGTVEQVHRLVQAVKKAFEEKEYCSALFIDVSQAFDKVWHTGLMCKLRQHLPHNTHKLLENYITNRNFIVKVGDYLSTPQPIKAGVPQGSILGPLLYLIYAADMPTSDNIHISTFADDTAFLVNHRNPVEASRCLQNHIHMLEKWLSLWRIKVNEQKCTHITFTLRRETCPPVLINNQVIPAHNHVKYLGVHLDRRLTWKSHIDAKLTQMKLKVAQIYWLIERNSVLSLDCKLLLYNSLLKPIWSYGIQLWGSASASNIEKIQRRQNKILRMITSAPWYIKNSHIHKDLDVPLVKSEIVKHSRTHLKKLEIHPNPLARNILRYGGPSRLKRRYTMDFRQN